ncbi:hypothetical protein PsalN5692_03870 (plasmid) [Piscirickettsia salmonis]|uniref:hypothetical protein n=1 Tax=Piscirickettsia salmonis TaxID=1238 RepID=UPI0012B95DCD|nr:hypothetical protein [Piscirickettsia salmonis]QGP52361.1 hypothetical protein PsalN5692_03870 [Piscirickettsia salmonis]
MNLKYPHIDQLGQYINEIIPQGKLSLNGKDTIDYDKLLIEIYRFALKSERKDGLPSGNKAASLKVACQKTIDLIDSNIEE